jgi:hypothetical protein
MTASAPRMAVSSDLRNLVTLPNRLRLNVGAYHVLRHCAAALHRKILPDDLNSDNFDESIIIMFRQVVI